MTQIFERVTVHCAYTAARRFVQEEGLRMVPNLPAYTLHLERARDPLQFDQRLHVEWTPNDGAPYPRFTGELVLRADGDAHDSVLELSGMYLPPFGVAGKAFDIVVGNKIASAAAKSVLRKMADAIENRAR